MTRSGGTSLVACAVGYASLIALMSWLLLQKTPPLDASGAPQTNPLDWLLFCLPVGLGIIAAFLQLRLPTGARKVVVIVLASLLVASPVWGPISGVAITCVSGHPLGVAVCSGLP